MSNKNEKKGEQLRREGKPRPKEPWFPTDSQKRASNDQKIGWDKEDRKRSDKAKK